MTSLYQIENYDLSECFSVLAKYLGTEAKSEQLHLVEGKIFKHLLQMGKIMLNQVILEQGDGRDIEFPNKSNLQLHRVITRDYQSIFGKIQIRRAYFWKKGAQGVCPLDAKLNLPERVHSYLLDKWIQQRVTEEPYDQAIESIADLLDIKISKRTVQQITNESSQQIERYYAQKSDFSDEGSHLIAQADCKGVKMVPKDRPPTKLTDKFTRRAKGVSKRGLKKDVVVTVEYSTNLFERDPKGILEGLMNINSNCKKVKKEKKLDVRNKQVSGTFGGMKKAFEKLADRIEARDPSCKKPVYFLVDGAISLKKGFMLEFEKRGWKERISGICLDIVHASEYLWDISTALYGEKSPQRVSWVRSSLEKFLNSEVRLVIEEVESKIANEKLRGFQIKRLNRSLMYFRNHEDMMDYKSYLKKGFPIASGAVEGACNNLVKGRTDRSGMQWTKQGAESVINLRSAQCNGDWESYWTYYVQYQYKERYESLAA